MRLRFRFIHFISILFILLEGCVDPLKIALLPLAQKFVVDGLITNDPGPYEVRLSYSSGLETSLKKALIASGASVWIYDNFNNSEKLAEVAPGVYQTSKTGIRGQIGREYWIKIKTKFGREYQTAPQRLTSTGEITNVGFQFVHDGILGKKPEQYQDNVYQDAVKILVDAKGVEGELNLFRWRWSTVYKARTFPELKRIQLAPTEVNGYLQVPTAPAPEPCSGYVVQGSGPREPGALFKVAECTCCECWPYNNSTAALVSHNRIVDGIGFNKVDLGLIPATTQQFYDKYFLKVEQLSLSEEIYNFWNLVEKQQLGQGNIFQPNSVRIHGNIQSLTDPEEEVLGIFGVSGITKKEMYIPANVVPYKLPLDTIKHDCSDSFLNDYKEKPLFW